MLVGEHFSAVQTKSTQCQRNTFNFLGIQCQIKYCWYGYEGGWLHKNKKLGVVVLELRLRLGL